MKSAIVFTLFVFLVFSGVSIPSGVFSQKTKRLELEKQRKSLQKDIAVTQNLLKDTRSRKDQSFNEMKLLQQEIALRRQLLSSMSSEISAIDSEITATQFAIADLENDIIRIRNEYGKLAYSTYIATGKKPEAFYVFSAGSLMESINRVRYFREISEYRKRQIDLIRKKQLMLQKKRIELEARRLQKEQLVHVKHMEAGKLVEVKNEKNKLFLGLKNQEQKYDGSIREKSNAIKKLDLQLQSLVEAEKSLTKEEYDKLLPLTNSFVQNKGKLPWPLPTSKGVITGNYGIVMDSNGIERNNKGIDISTMKGQVIRSVYEGDVVFASEMPYVGYVVMIRHGVDYRSVYSNLGSISIKVGDHVVELQTIGMAKTDEDTQETSMHFRMLKGKESMNPEQWLVRKQ